MFQKGPGKTKASHQPKAEMEANKKKNAEKENIRNDSDETQIVY